jgi:CBS domain-containing protein
VTGGASQGFARLASVSMVDLLRSASDLRFRDLVQENVPPHLHVDEGLEQVALLMADFTMTTAAVVDRAGRRVVGVVTADDLIEALVPRQWRRRQSAGGRPDYASVGGDADIPGPCRSIFDAARILSADGGSCCVTLSTPTAASVAASAAAPALDAAR